MTTKQILKAALKLIDKPDRWLQGDMARNPATGRPVQIESPKAGQFCALGAVWRAGLDTDVFTRQRAVRTLAGAIEGRAVTVWNDEEDTTHADVVAAFKRAIKEAA